MSRLELAGILSAADVRQTAAAIAEVQEPTGAIPWEPGGRTDPWDHVESAMGLDVGGLHDAAERAYRWLQRVQRDDGSWAAAYRGGAVEDPTADANFCAYPAVGVWHHFLATGHRDFVADMWRTVQRALDFALGLQAPGGEVWWALDPVAGRVWTAPLLAGNASMYHSLRCGLALSAVLGDPQPNWEVAVGRVGHALTAHPERFDAKDRWAMDWYYPVLAGALRAEPARRRIAERWDEFVVPGLGIRCVLDRPWVTGAETCELALALDALGARDRAATLVAWMQHLRAADGSYWTGYVYDDDEHWPLERSTWTAAAVLLAVDALADRSATAGLFRGADLPAGFDASGFCHEAACAGLAVPS